MPTQPLAGLRILELANVVAGPSVGKHLSDFGAEVIKVERPGEGDAARTMGRRVGSETAWWLSIGANKRLITLDLRSEAGREALLRLAETADAVVESFRPGVLERLGLGPDALHARNDRLVIVRVSAFGQTGPMSDRPGFGTLAEAFSGLASISGYADRPPLLPSFALADEVSGLFATWALMTALYHRDVHGGEGQTIDVSLYESVLSILGPLPALHRHDGHTQQRKGSRLPFSSPRNVYRTRDGRHFVVSGTAPSAAEAILRLVGGDELLADERFCTPAARGAHGDALDEVVAAWMGARDIEEVEAAFERAGAAGIRVMDIADVLADAHCQARQTIVDVPTDEVGTVALAAPVPRMSKTPGRIAHAGRSLGAHTDEILAEIGLSDDEIHAGRVAGAW